jgi:hypothetical protein
MVALATHVAEEGLVDVSILYYKMAHLSVVSCRLKVCRVSTLFEEVEIDSPKNKLIAPTPWAKFKLSLLYFCYVVLVKWNGFNVLNKFYVFSFYKLLFTSLFPRAIFLVLSLDGS